MQTIIHSKCRTISSGNTMFIQADWSVTKMKQNRYLPKIKPRNGYYSFKHRQYRCGLTLGCPNLKQHHLEYIIKWNKVFRYLCLYVFLT